MIIKELLCFESAVNIVMISRYNSLERSLLDEPTLNVVLERFDTTIPPKYSVSQVVGFLKGKSTILVARKFAGRDRNFTGLVFWARGYYVSTMGADEATIRRYIRYQENTERKEDAPRLFK